MVLPNLIIINIIHFVWITRTKSSFVNTFSPSQTSVSSTPCGLYSSIGLYSGTANLLPTLIASSECRDIPCTLYCVWKLRKSCLLNRVGLSPHLTSSRILSIHTPSFIFAAVGWLWLMLQSELESQDDCPSCALIIHFCKNRVYYKLHTKTRLYEMLGPTNINSDSIITT